MVPNIGIKYDTWDWKIKPLFTKILNLNNQAIPVDTKPRYTTEIVDWTDGL